MIIFVLGTEFIGIIGTTICETIDECVVIENVKDNSTVMKSAEVCILCLKNKECIAISPVDIEIHISTSKYITSVVIKNYNCSIVLLHIIQLESTYG